MKVILIVSVFAIKGGDGIHTHSYTVPFESMDLCEQAAWDLEKFPDRKWGVFYRYPSCVVVAK